MRKPVLLLVLALALTACGGSPGTGASGLAEEATTSGAPAEDAPRPIDFELTLSDGSTFRLSDEEKPVYLVFWAEW